MMGLLGVEKNLVKGAEKLKNSGYGCRKRRNGLNLHANPAHALVNNCVEEAFRLFHDTVFVGINDRRGLKPSASVVR
jgi:hypothetical protein